MKLGKVKGEALGAVLQKVLDQVQCTYRVKDDHIEIIAKEKK